MNLFISPLCQLKFELVRSTLSYFHKSHALRPINLPVLLSVVLIRDCPAMEQSNREDNS